MVSEIDFKFTFYSKIFHVRVQACTNGYLTCTTCEVHDRVRKHVIRCTKKRVPRFLILVALEYSMLPKPCIALLKCKRNFEKKKTVATNFNF